MNKTKKGYINILMFIFCILLIIIVFFAFTLERYLINTKGNMAKDGIILSNLATYKNISKKALGDNPNLFKFENDAALSNDKVTPDSIKAYKTFEEYLSANMRLDGNLVGLSNSIAKGKVNITRYIIYNVSENSIEILTYNNLSNSFSVKEVNKGIETVLTPAGTEVDKTMIHTTIKFNIVPMMKGILGQTREVTVMADTDITK